MLQISRSQDLRRLRDEGYDIEIRSSFLLVKGVPYVTAKCEVDRGVLVSTLTTAGDVTTQPETHVAMFAGDFPCDRHGRPIRKIEHSTAGRLAPDLVVNHSFSAKPPGGSYADYYEKMTTYVAILSGPAQAIDPAATARTYPVLTPEVSESVFNYMETASGRAGIAIATQKLEQAKVGIVGLGGTGSYVLDLVAKTPVSQIHLFDNDELLTHNAFRGPGAPSVEELRAKPRKVAHWRGLYSNMHRGIVAHEYLIDGTNAAELRGMGFVFLCIDAGEAKRVIVETLEESGTPFIDVGLGVELVGDSLRGQLRVTASNPNRRDHFRNRVSLANSDVDDDYGTNIQVADLNALNAALAVIRWKKWCGFYLDFEREHNSTYVIDCNALINDDAE